MQALATKERRVSLAPLDHLAPLAFQAPQQSFQLVVMAQLFPGSPDPEDHLDQQVPQAPRDHQERRESQLVDCSFKFLLENAEFKFSDCFLLFYLYLYGISLIYKSV